VTIYLRVGEPDWLTTGSTRVSRVKNQPILKFVRKFQPNPARTVVSRVDSRVPIHFDNSKKEDDLFYL